MTTTQLKQLIAERFAKDGQYINVRQSLLHLEHKIAEHTGAPRHKGESQWAYLCRFAGVERMQPKTMKRPELKLDRTLSLNMERAAQAQPRMITPNGIGNGVERQHGYGRGA